MACDATLTILPQVSGRSDLGSLRREKTDLTWGAADRRTAARRAAAATATHPGGGGGGAEGVGGGGRRARSALEQSWESLSVFTHRNMSRMEVQGSPEMLGAAPDDRAAGAGAGGPGCVAESTEFGDILDSAMALQPEPQQQTLGAVAEEAGEEEELGEVSVEVPTLPRGRTLRIEILSTWGDLYYVGLTGVELFDERGRMLPLSEEQVSAVPADVNVLPGYCSDPRTVDKLVDGVHRTTDDLHMWLAPWTPGRRVVVTVQLPAGGDDRDDAAVTISMLRVWNYNKSRIHAHRGAKDVAVSLDGAHIFAGQIGRAAGITEGAEDAAEHILFTTDASIVASIEATLAAQHPPDEVSAPPGGGAQLGGALPSTLDTAAAFAFAERPITREVPVLGGGGAAGTREFGFANGAGLSGIDGGCAGESDGYAAGGGIGLERPTTSAGTRDAMTTHRTMSGGLASQGYETPLHIDHDQNSGLTKI